MVAVPDVPITTTGTNRCSRRSANFAQPQGTVSIPGVYGGFVDKVPFGAAFNKGLTLKMGQTHVQKYMLPLLDRLERGEIDPSFIITHHLNLEEAPRGYEIFKHKQDQCLKIVLKPQSLSGGGQMAYA